MELEIYMLATISTRKIYLVILSKIYGIFAAHFGLSIERLAFNVYMSSIAIFIKMQKFSDQPEYPQKS